jgi:phosphomevalonate kinase
MNSLLFLPLLPRQLLLHGSALCRQCLRFDPCKQERKLQKTGVRNSTISNHTVFLFSSFIFPKNVVLLSNLSLFLKRHRSTVYSYRLVCFPQLLGEPGTGGSSTPSMVGAVKKWQKSDPQKSLDTWRKLLEANSSLEVQFNMLSKLAEEHWDAYKCIIDICSRLRSDKVILELIFSRLQWKYY